MLTSFRCQARHSKRSSIQISISFQVEDFAKIRRYTVYSHQLKAPQIHNGTSSRACPLPAPRHNARSPGGKHATSMTAKPAQWHKRVSYIALCRKALEVTNGDEDNRDNSQDRCQIRQIRPFQVLHWTVVVTPTIFPGTFAPWNFPLVLPESVLNIYKFLFILP